MSRKDWTSLELASRLELACAIRERALGSRTKSDAERETQRKVRHIEPAEKRELM